MWIYSFRFCLFSSITLPGWPQVLKYTKSSRLFSNIMIGHSRKRADDIFSGLQSQCGICERGKKFYKGCENYIHGSGLTVVFLGCSRSQPLMSVSFSSLPLSLSLGSFFSVLFWATEHSSFIPFVSCRRTSSWKAHPAFAATMPVIVWPLEPPTTLVCWYVASLLF